MAANEPQTDREFVIQMAGKIDRLNDNIERLSEVLEHMEIGRINPLENRVKDLESWRSEWKGSWRFVVAATMVLTFVLTILQIKESLGK